MNQRSSDDDYAEWMADERAEDERERARLSDGQRSLPTERNEEE